MVGLGTPVGAAEPSPGQVWLTLASYGQLWCGRALLCAVGPSQVRPDPARCSRHCTFALVQLSKVHLFIVIPIFVYLQVKIPAKLVEPH
jgi:hypothetical protein